MTPLIEPKAFGPRLVQDICIGDGVALSVWRLGQSGVVCRFGGGQIVVIDAYLSNHCEAALPQPFDHRRMTRAPLDGCELGFVDVLVCTHDHLDHLDVPTLRSAARLSSMRVVAPTACGPTLRSLGWDADRSVLTEVGTDFELAGLQFRPFAVPHEQFHVDPVTGHPYQGFVISDGVVSIVHLGDSVSHPSIVDALREQNVDVAFMPINGRSEARASMGFAGNMNAAEAVQLGKEIGVGTVVPVHYDMFAQNVDDRALGTFRSLADDNGLDYRVLDVGAAWHRPHDNLED